MKLPPIKTLVFKSAIVINCILALVFGYSILIYGFAPPEYRPGAKTTDIITPLIVFGIAVLLSIVLPIWLKNREVGTTKKTTIATLLAYCPIISIALLLINNTLKSHKSNKQTKELIQMLEKKHPEPKINVDGFSISGERKNNIAQQLPNQ